MKHLSLILSTTLASLLVGCATAPVALAPVGPNPAYGHRPGSEGQLQVFSCLEPQTDDQNQGSTDPIWFQHTGYSVYTPQGRLVERVDNTVGHYALAPRLVNLPDGHYYIQAHAAGYVMVKVPVTIASGQTTRVHLDNAWHPPVGIVKTELVRLPGGQLWAGALRPGNEQRSADVVNDWSLIGD